MRAIEAQRLAGWMQLLDDPEHIDTAQAVLRLPLAELPVPPIALPETPNPDPWASDVAPAVEAPRADEVPVAAPVAPGARRPLRGAYARRAAASGGGSG